jgi:threonine synthase
MSYLVKQIKIDDKIDFLADFLYKNLEKFAEPKDELVADLTYHEKRFCLAAYDGNKIVGVCLCNYLSFFKMFHITQLAVEPAYRGKNIGTNLIKKALELTNNNLSLHVDAENKKGYELYKNLGFVTKKYRMFYKDAKRQYK